MKKAERHEYILKTAREMAKSGEHRDFTTIEVTLRADGLHEARQVLDNQFIRNELNELCKKAQSESAD